MSQRAWTATASSWSTQAKYRGGQARDVGLRLVGPVRKRAQRAPFVVVVMSVLVSGFAGLGFFSTVMQAQSFAIYELSGEVAMLEAKREELATTVNDLQSPASIADRALREGMVPNTNPVFLRLQDGRVIGNPVPALPKTNVRKVD